ncbi:ACT domain-containing protein DS12, chloroplastic-like [Magnolia sinica]|uniref:ACT domain-containing protein DS12, chloroplastic-like n=1 Tax=Magnolia sinica TaxID=86752 RepID=UPI002658E231|nr:ACT domain-containing protein DS12, chloroplastic-like [Magnolia sinica]
MQLHELALDTRVTCFASSSSSSTRIQSNHKTAGISHFATTAPFSLRILLQHSLLLLRERMAGAMRTGSLGSCFGPKHGDNPHPTIGLRVRAFGSDRRFCWVPYKSRWLSTTANIPKAAPTSVEGGSSGETDTVPTPKVIIDQDSDPNATVVEITFGDRLGALLDTMHALKNLGLNVVKANVFLDSSGKHNTFAITRAVTGRKVDNPELLEKIRLTIINNLLQYHPESSAQLAMGATFGVEPPKEKVDVDIATHIHIHDDGPDRSLLYVETADRPGLLVDLVQIITDTNIAVVSGEFDTEGLLAKAKFHVSYQGKDISKPMQQVLSNSLRYFLRRPTTEEASF